MVFLSTLKRIYRNSALYTNQKDIYFKAKIKLVSLLSFKHAPFEVWLERFHIKYVVIEKVKKMQISGSRHHTVPVRGRKPPILFKEYFTQKQLKKKRKCLVIILF